MNRKEVDWKALSPLELVQYLVTEAAKDPDYASTGRNKCIDFLVSPLASDFSTMSASSSSLKDSIVSQSVDHEEELDEDGVTISISSSSSFPKLIDYSKKDFSEVMNAWLRENWTNPYPDEEGLVQIANSCGCTTSVVSNWLINARTRKWRPAIVKAFENGRPASLLHEDSINIFDGKPLRQN